jgi:hypothetical protein
MCFSFRTSIISYSLGMLSGAFAIYTGQWMLGTLILFYSQMQLAEAFIWKGIDENNLKLNRIGTAYGKYALGTHNFAIGLGLIFSVILIQKRELVLRDFIPLVIGIIFYGIVMMIYANTKSLDVTFPANKCSSNPRECQNWGNRLRWPFPHKWYVISYVISLGLLFLFYDGPIRSKVFLLIIFSILFAGTAIITPNSVGSAWCFSTAVAAPIIVGINWLLTRSQ